MAEGGVGAVGTQPPGGCLPADAARAQATRAQGQRVRAAPRRCPQGDEAGPVMTGWRQVVGRARADRELAQEIEAHIAERADDLIDQGMSSAEARRTALREFGNPVRCVEDSRAVWLIPWLVSLGQDVRYVLRALRRQPVFSVSVILILTCGIGLVTTLFTVFPARVFRPWPVPDPPSISVLKPRPASNAPYGTLSNVEYRYLREHARSFSHLPSSIGGGGPGGPRHRSPLAVPPSQHAS